MCVVHVDFVIFTPSMDDSLYSRTILSRRYRQGKIDGYNGTGRKEKLRVFITSACDGLLAQIGSEERVLSKIIQSIVQEIRVTFFELFCNVSTYPLPSGPENFTTVVSS